jgi:hypothetical protein
MSVRRLVMVAFLGATVSAAAACSSPAPPHSGQSGPPAPATSQPAGSGNANAAASSSECAKAPSAQVGKALGLTVGKVTVTVEGTVTVCAYAGRYPVVVRYQTGENTSLFAQARQNQVSLHEAVGTVNGLGDSAYFASYTASTPVSNTLGALKGSIAIFITSPASSAAESTLMTDLLKNV